MDDFIWLRHADTGGTFRCPADAAEAWQARGWEPCAAPAEQDPATAEWQPLIPPTPVGEPKPPKGKGSREVPAEGQASG